MIRYILLLTCLGICGGVPTAMATLEQGLVGHWTFDDCERDQTISSVQDQSFNGYTGKAEGSPLCAFGIIGNAVRFASDGDAVVIPGVPTSPYAYTYTLWFSLAQNAFSNSPRQDLLYGGQEGEARPHITLNRKPPGDGSLGLFVNIDGASHDDVTTTPRDVWDASRWRHAAFTWDGRDFRIYVDGRLASTVRHEGLSSSHQGIILGMRRDGKHPFRGRLDDVRLYQRALSASEIDQLANPLFEPPRFLNADDLSLSSNDPHRIINMPKNMTPRLPEADGSDSYYDHERIDPGQERDTLQNWRHLHGFTTSPSVINAKYINTADLGFRRDMYCRNDGDAFPCYVSNYVFPPKGIPGLVAYWSFDDDCRLNDDSGHGYPSGGLGGDVICVEGVHGQALDLSAASDMPGYAQMPNVPVPPHGHTYSLWFRPAETIQAGDSRMDLLYGGPSADHPRPHITLNRAGDGRLGFYARLNDVSFNDITTQTTQWEKGKWYHVAATWDGVTFVLFVNGKEERRAHHSSGPSNTYKGIMLGIRRDLKHPFNGSLDEVRIYNRALSSGEVRALSQGQLAASVATERRRTSGGLDYVAFFVFDQNGKRVNAVTLDSEGPKSVPESCLGCHMGNNTWRNRSQYLPFDLDAFADWPGQLQTVQEQQAAFQELNRLVYDSVRPREKESIHELIELWYAKSPGSPPEPGDVFRARQVPSGNEPQGWYSGNGDLRIQETALYRDFYAPYCRLCHVTQRDLPISGSLRSIDRDERNRGRNFISARHFVSAIDQMDVCDIDNDGMARQPLMPNAEQTLKNFLPHRAALCNLVNDLRRRYRQQANCLDVKNVGLTHPNQFDYARDIERNIFSGCTQSGCHTNANIATQSPAAGLVLTEGQSLHPAFFFGLLDSPGLVAPGDAAASGLIEKISCRNPSWGGSMRSLGGLTENKIKLIAAWINSLTGPLVEIGE